MKALNRILTNQLGVSLPIVIMLVTAALGSIGYLTVNLLPKLQDGKKKAEQALDYKIFIGSLNDYLIHGIRERWCVNVTNVDSDNVATTDLLLSNECSSTKPMETVVTYAGNLERLLWDNITIGGDTSDQGTQIVGLNYQRRQPPTIKTTVVLKADDVKLKNKKMLLRINETILNDMTDVHPLYTLTRKIKDCVDQVDIVITQLSTNNIGDEKKLKIDIEVDIKETRLACMAHKTVRATSYYTFYPRRLHNFALIKYGDMGTTQFNEFHGPVYVAGNIVLPSGSTIASNSTIFYDSLTLGTYNAGGTMSSSSSGFYAGNVVNNDGTKFTFVERGDPYIGKQDNYPNFRGFLGGLRLDAVEDKGLYNLFDGSNTNGSDVATLERCIDENKVKTTPSVNAGTVLGYTNLANSAGSSPGTIAFLTGISKLNRFKPVDTSPAVSTDQPESSAKKFIVSVSATPNGTKSVGVVKFNADASNEYAGTVGSGAEVKFEIDMAKYGMDATTIDVMIAALNAPKTKDGFDDIIPSGHMLRKVAQNEWDDYVDDGDKLIQKCDNKPSIEHCTLTFPTDYATTTCSYLVDNSCDQSSWLLNFNSSKTALINKLNAIKADLPTTANPAAMIAKVDDVIGTGSKMVINHKTLTLSFTSKWKTYYPAIADDFTDPILTFTAFHYGSDVLSVALSVKKDPAVLLQLRRQDNNNNANIVNSFIGWKDTFDNSNITDITALYEIDCPTGMGLADWDLDMSPSTNFSWNYANNSPGSPVMVTSHSNNNDELKFIKDETIGQMKDGDGVLTKSIFESCFVPKDRLFVYGFFVCKTLTIQSGRSAPLYMIGTFIVKDLNNNETSKPTYWHSIWTPLARDSVLVNLNKTTPGCTGDPLINKTFVDIVADPTIEDTIKKCSSQELVTNGPNNFTWTTVDPEIGLKPGDIMTSQKVKRYLRWITREDSRKDIIK